ncbi:retrovirus-related pol polyprotein from transposon TNT 1-94 [Tanacetum coccineum]
MCYDDSSLVTPRISALAGCDIYALKQAPRARFQIKQSERGISINQEKYVKDLLQKYDINGSSVKTPMIPLNNLGLDLIDKVVNETQYRRMIGSLMYLKAMSLAEVEYVAAARFCANILWMKSQLTDYDIIYEKEMWERIKRLMYGSEVTNHVRHSRLMDEFDKFAAKEGESLESMYERLTTLVNIMDLQFEPHIQASKAKRAARNHDPLALIAHSNASSQSHASPSYSNSPQPYYVTHPSSIVDYEEDYHEELHRDSQEDKLITAMMLLARAITQKFSTPTNNRLCTSSNTRNQAVIQDGRVDIQTKNAGYGGNVYMNAKRQNKNQAFNEGNMNDESNQIVQRVPRTESNPRKANVQCYNCNEKGHYARDCDDNALTEPTYDAKAISEVNASYKAHKQVNHVKRKTIIHASDDDQIDSNIIFDDPYVENNGTISKHDSNDHDEYHNIQILAYNVQRETENIK